MSESKHRQRQTPEPDPLPQFASDKERADFYESSFRNCYARLVVVEERLAALLEETKTHDNRVKKRYHEQIKTQNHMLLEYARDAARYNFLRQFQVQVWRLGIVAAEGQLDQLLTVAIERSQKTPLLIEQGGK